MLPLLQAMATFFGVPIGPAYADEKAIVVAKRSKSNVVNIADKKEQVTPQIPVIETPFGAIFDEAFFGVPIGPAYADEKAEALLLSWLSPSQRYEWLASEQFTVAGSLGGQYVITKSAIYNVIAADGGRMCFRPRASLSLLEGDWPVCDILLAQKLALEHDEAYVLRVANRSSGQMRYPYLMDQCGWRDYECD